MPTPRVIIVTGANRGIGRAICQNILSRPSHGPLKLFATCRNTKNVTAFTTGPADDEVIYSDLDVANSESIRDFEHRVRQHSDHVDVLINNAGVNLDARYGPETAKATLDVNYRGTLEMCQTFLPRLASTGRIVNLSSVASSLKLYDEAVQARLRDPMATLSDLEQLAQEYESSVRASTEQSQGFGVPFRAYSFSKALVRALTSILARDHRDAHPSSGVLINCCCPGWIDTDMGSSISSRGTRPPKTVEEGARIPIRLALDDDFGGVSGTYFANDSVRSKELGRVQEW